MKKITVLIMVLIMILSTNVCYSTNQYTEYLANQYKNYPVDSTEFLNKSIYLKDMGVLTGGIDIYSRVSALTRSTEAVVLARVMNVTDPNWKKSSKHTFKDVPKWADQYIGYVVENGIMRGLDDTTFASNETVDVKSFTTTLLRVLGYGYNDTVQEFTWDESLKTALEVGLISDAEYKQMRGEDILSRGIMVRLAYNAVKLCNNDPYTDKYLKELVEANPPSDEIKALRNNDDPTREGYIKASFIYYDIYYPDTEEAKNCIKLLTPHANKVYAMLQNMYGIQPAFDVYLLPNDQLEVLTQSTAPGQHPIVKNNHMTYVVLAKDQDADGNNLGELVRELNNVFYDNSVNLSSNKMSYTEDTLPWKVRANMNLIGSLYTKLNYSGKVDQPSMFEIPSMRISLRDADKCGMSSYDKNRLYEYYYYSKLFSLKDPSKFKGCLKNLGEEKAMAPPSMPGSLLELDKSFVKLK